MPEGHTLRRLALELTDAFAGRPVRVSSPQGRFAADAAQVDGVLCVGAESAAPTRLCCSWGSLARS